MFEKENNNNNGGRPDFRSPPRFGGFPPRMGMSPRGEHHRHFPPPPDPFGFHPHKRHHGHHPPPPPLPLDPETFKELKVFFILTILSDNPDGITAYQMESKYKFPRTSVSRLMEKLIEDKYVETIETEDSGRKQTIYKLTEEGMTFLESLKEVWAGRFTMMEELAPFDRYANPFMRNRVYGRLLRNIDDINSKEDVEDYLRGARSKLKHKITSLQQRIDKLKVTKDELDNLIKTISEQDPFDKEAVKTMIEDIQKKMIEKK